MANEPENLTLRLLREMREQMVTKDDLKGLATLARSFVELHTLPAEPDMSKLYTEAFLPAR